MITIARNRLRMNVLTHMMCYEHPTVHFSDALLTKIRFWSKKVSTRRDGFKVDETQESYVSSFLLKL